MAYLSIFFHKIIIASLVLCHTSTLAKNHTDHLSLLAIKSSITHDPQRVLDSWNTSFHFCQWQGVICGHRHPRVTVLDLGSRGIVGSLSPHVGNLSFLRVLKLKNNTFKGAIPSQVGNLFRLQKLLLANNSFEGEIPSSLSNCTRLNVFELANNKLVGKIPQELSSLLNLVIILIGFNSLTGGIPYFFGNFTFLTRLYATGNNLSGSIPHALGQLQNLQRIGFGENQLNGTVPPSLYNITSLAFVALPGNDIGGNLPRDIGLQLPNLVAFQIWGNKFTGNIPFSFSSCSNLEHLDLSQNGFTGKINIDFRHMPNIWFLSIFSNNLGGTWESNDMNFIDSLINCTKLEKLFVHDNQFSGPLPTSVGNLSSQLSALSLDKNFIHGPLPSGIGNLVKLTELYVEFNHFTGIIPSELGNLQNLQYLHLDKNNFTGNVPEFVGNLSLLLELGLAGNHLHGQIPSSLCNCTRLASLDFSENRLTGPIPIELFQMSSLSIVLNLFHNHLAGPLPQAIGNLKNLVALDLSKNDITGEIPNGIGSCTSLEYLILKENSFQGPIPLQMSDLRGVREIDLSGNNFSGQIPRFLEQLDLSSLNLSFNNLDGEVPMGGIFKNASRISVNGNSKLCGGIRELGLPKCALLARSKKHSRIPRVVVTPLCVLLVATSLLALMFCCWQRRKRQAHPTTEASLVPPFSRVSYGSLLKATNEFSLQNLIGSGTFSDVYKGILEQEGGMVAIKVLKLGNQGASKSFMAECEALKNIRHRNLVKIITSCSSIDFQGNDFKALIYEFMPNGNLDSWLHPSSEQDGDTEQVPRRLNFQQRVAIATDVAHAIHYLHQDCEIPIIHCDLKPSNILLDSDMIAHIGDFGLAKFLPLKPRESSSFGIRGTIGYAAPEYGLGSEMTKEGDIYSFGILLLEMITGKRPTDPIFQDGMNLHGYVKTALPDHLTEIIEPTLLSVHENAANIGNHGYLSRDEARKWKIFEEGVISLARIGVACSMESPKERMDTSSMGHEMGRINEKLRFN